MPSVSSASGTEPVSTAFGVAALPASTSVIALALLPFSSLQAEPRNENGGEQERDHRGRDGGTFAKIAAHDRALVRKRCHQVRCIDRSTTRHHPDQLEVGESEQH